MKTNNENLPVYVCHKRVRALEIDDVDLTECIVSFSNPAFAPRQLDCSVFVRYIPKPGDFYVVYEDGYESFSPRKAFLDGYTRAVSCYASAEPLDVPTEPSHLDGWLTVPKFPSYEMPRSQIIGIACLIGIVFMLIAIIAAAMIFPPT